MPRDALWAVPVSGLPANDNPTLVDEIAAQVGCDVLRERCRLAAAPSFDACENLGPRETMVRSCAMMILRIEAWDREVKT